MGLACCLNVKGDVKVTNSAVRLAGQELVLSVKAEGG